MADILTPTKALAVNPLKASQPIGASLAFLGIADCMPLEHGARGCASFNKLFFMRHFNEPIPLQTTAMDQTTTVLGADGDVVEALATICKKNAPRVIGLVTTGLSEMQGADVPRTIHEFRKAHPECADVAVVPVSASDTLGCLETGFAAAVEAIIATLVKRRPGAARKLPRQVNVLASAMLTPGDLEDLRLWIEAFGLTPILLPDIGASLDGHLIEAGYSTLTYGGVTRAEIESMGESAATLVVGRSMNKAADLLKEQTGVPDWRFDQLIGLPAADAFTQALADISGVAVPARLAGKRDQLTDAMVDCQFQFGGARVGVAGDADLVAALTEFFVGMGSDIIAVASARAPRLADLPIENVIVGDLEDFETLVSDGEPDLIITNSHGAEIARRTGAAFLRAGFPIYDSYGAHAESWIGYGGARRLIFTAANLLAGHYQELRPYVSRYRPQAAE
jgi:nitrogenase molybdenum-iron protein NifN